MNKGFQLLRQKAENENYDIKALENEYNIILPPQFRFFVSYFYVSNDCFIIDKFYHPIYKILYPFVEIQFCPLVYSQNRPISITGFEDIESLFKEWAFSIHEVEWKEYSLLRITNISTGGNLFLGTVGDMTDCIYRVDWASGNRESEKIANNILEFILGLESLEMPTEIMITRGVKYSQLYKNWGEDFWRVRENESE